MQHTCLLWTWSHRKTPCHCPGHRRWPTVVLVENPRPIEREPPSFQKNSATPGTTTRRASLPPVVTTTHHTTNYPTFLLISGKNGVAIIVTSHSLKITSSCKWCLPHLLTLLPRVTHLLAAVSTFIRVMDSVHCEVRNGVPRHAFHPVRCRRRHVNVPRPKIALIIINPKFLENASEDANTRDHSNRNVSRPQL